MCESDSLETKLEKFKIKYSPGVCNDLLEYNKNAIFEEVKYILVGLNPGNEEINNKLSNFHGDKKSRDYRLAALLHGTDIWGAFMTDLIDKSESDSSKIKVNDSAIIDLEKRLDELGIKDSASVIFLTTKAKGAAISAKNKGLFKRKVEYICHYSSSNNAKWVKSNHKNLIEMRDKIISNQEN